MSYTHVPLPYTSQPHVVKELEELKQDLDRYKSIYHKPRNNDDAKMAKKMEEAIQAELFPLHKDLAKYSAFKNIKVEIGNPDAWSKTFSDDVDLEFESNPEDAMKAYKCAKDYSKSDIDILFIAKAPKFTLVCFLDTKHEMIRYGAIGNIQFHTDDSSYAPAEQFRHLLQMEYMYDSMNDDQALLKRKHADYFFLLATRDVADAKTDFSDDLYVDMQDLCDRTIGPGSNDGCRVDSNTQDAVYSTHHFYTHILSYPEMKRFIKAIGDGVDYVLKAERKKFLDTLVNVAESDKEEEDEEAEAEESVLQQLMNDPIVPHFRPVEKTITIWYPKINHN